jgi:hypothetical protein
MQGAFAHYRIGVALSPTKAMEQITTATLLWPEFPRFLQYFLDRHSD